MHRSFLMFLFDSFAGQSIILIALNLFFILNLRLCIKKYPPYVEKKDKYLDTLIVHAPYLRRRLVFGGYDDFTFVKKKNGKYRIKLSIPDLIFFLLSVIFFYGIYILLLIGLITDGHMGGEPLSIILYLYLFLFFTGFFIAINFSKFVAIIYFKKLLKGLKKEAHLKERKKR